MATALLNSMSIKRSMQARNTSSRSFWKKLEARQLASPTISRSSLRVCQLKEKVREVAVVVKATQNRTAAVETARINRQRMGRQIMSLRMVSSLLMTQQELKKLSYRNLESSVKVLSSLRTRFRASKWTSGLSLKCIQLTLLVEHRSNSSVLWIWIALRMTLSKCLISQC